jgi:hypothetical protein
MALTQKQIRDVCCLYQGSSQCRYLDSDTDSLGNIVLVCKKKHPDKNIIDDELKTYVIKLRKKGKDPLKENVPLGNNCQGYIKLTDKKQGYDVP